MPSHFAAARGAYVMREFKPGERHGAIFVQGTMTTANLVKLLPKLDERGLNVKIVAAISPQLFALQDAAYRERTVSLADWHDAMTITNRALRTMRDWIKNDVVAEYSLTSDWDARWRTGGTVDEVIAEAHLDPEHLLAGVERFARERPQRLAKLRQAADAASRHDGAGGRSG